MYITGKGRCNITNNCTTQEFFAYVARNPKFLTSALWALPPEELIEKLNGLGLATKVERGGRVFPESDKSSDVIKCLGKMLQSAKVQVLLNMNVRGILKTEEGFTVRTDVRNFDAKSVVVATGGASYSQTGSTGDGYTFAKEFGHAVLGPHPALSALIEKGNICASLQGLSLKNVQFTLVQAGRAVYSELGEMLFTHEGLSGPLVLSASSAVNYDKPLELKCSIDLKPALSTEKLDARILRDFEQNKNKQIRNVLGELLPQRMIDSVLGFAGIDGGKPVNSITKK
ncbi:MAG: aminoacetone oxidase family FAD-binding enzyme, partial [Eubacteriales bacterium]